MDVNGQGIATPSPRARAIMVLALAGAMAVGAAGATRVTAQADRSRCRVAPRPVAFFAELAATPVATLATVATPLPASEGRGEPADAETIAEIEAAVAELAACRSLGDVLRLDALYTDGFFVRQVAELGPPSDEVLANLAASPAPLPVAQRAATVTVRGVEVLADGRVRAVIELDLARGSASLLTVFVREGERWLIDEETVLP